MVLLHSLIKVLFEKFVDRSNMPQIILFSIRPRKRFFAAIDAAGVAVLVPNNRRIFFKDLFSEVSDQVRVQIYFAWVLLSTDLAWEESIGFALALYCLFTPFFLDRLVVVVIAYLSVAVSALVVHQL